MFEQLRAFVGDNAAALALIDTLEGTTTSNIQTINDHEKTINEIKGTRDKYKGGNTLIKSLLGVEAVNEETIKEALKALKGGKGDEQSLAEIENLKGLLEKATNDNTDLKTGYEGKLQSMALDNALANAGLGANVANEAMYGIVSALVREGATFENDAIVYKNIDGTTAYGKNNTPLGITDKIDQLKTDPNYAGLFKVDVNPGSGSPAITIVAGQGDQVPMKGTEMMKAGRE